MGKPSTIIRFIFFFLFFFAFTFVDLHFIRWVPLHDPFPTKWTVAIAVVLGLGAGAYSVRNIWSRRRNSEAGDCE